MDQDSRNLAPGRGPSVWNRAQRSGEELERQERAAIGLVAAALAVEGLRRRTFAGAVLAGLAGTVAVRAAWGANDAKALRTWVARLCSGSAGPTPDAVETASAESFPASDAPAWTSRSQEG